MNKNIFKHKSLAQFIILTTLSNILLSIVITIVFAFISGYKFLNILTPSMTPTMPVKTIVVVKKIPITDVEVGDVITYKTNEGSNVTHRVVEVLNNGNALRTKGDAANGNDQFLTTEKNFVGVVVFYVKGLGYLFELIKDNIIFILVAGVLAIFIVTNT